MKSLKFSFQFLLWLSIASLTSCKKDSNSTTKINDSATVVNIVNDGTWRITYYFDTDHEETSSFVGYNFSFGSSNVLTATNGTNTYSGSWNVTDSNSADDNLSELDFNITFISPAQFAKLTDDWEIIEKSSNLIRLRDISGGNGGIDYLTFTKN